jgi:hypothetical protein
MRSPRNVMFAPTTGPRSTSSADGRANRRLRNCARVLLEETVSLDPRSENLPLS